MSLRMKAFDGLATIDSLIETTKNHNITDKQQVNFLPLASLIPGKSQPRTLFNDASLNDLAESIRDNGIIQPLIVRGLKEKSGMYEIIAGERRWRAAKLLSLSVVPAIVRNIDNETAAVFALIENIQREDLNPIDQAESLAKLQTEFSLTHEQIAKRVGWSRSTITNSLRLLELENGVRDLIRLKKLSAGHGKLLLGFSIEKQADLADKIIKQQWSVRDTEKQLKKLHFNSSEVTKTLDFPSKNELKSIEERLHFKINNTVRCTLSRKKIKVSMVFDTIEETEDFLKNLIDHSS